MLFGSIESREKGGKQYIYVHYRLNGVLTTKYAGEYSDVLYNLIRNNTELAKNFKKRLKEINKTLKELNYIEAEDVDENGVGEIVTKGPNVMLGYYEDEAATKEVLKDGWFHTGDLGYYNKDGYLFITGRKKEVIVLKNGENVFPSDIEFLVNKLPYVKESMLFPRENSKGEIALGIKVVYDENEIKSHFGDKTEKEYKDLVWEDIKEINKNLSQFKRIKELILTKEE